MTCCMIDANTDDLDDFVFIPAFACFQLIAPNKPAQPVFRQIAPFVLPHVQHKLAFILTVHSYYINTINAFDNVV